MEIFLEYTKNVDKNIRIVIWLGILALLTLLIAKVLPWILNVVIRLGKKIVYTCTNAVRMLRICVYDMQLKKVKSNEKRNQIIRAGNALSEIIEGQGDSVGRFYHFKFIKIARNVIVILLIVAIVLMLSGVENGIADWLEGIYLNVETDIKLFLKNMKL